MPNNIDQALATLESIAERLAFVRPPYDLANTAETADDFEGELLVLDYLQRIKPPGEHADRRGSVDSVMGYLRGFVDVGCAVLCVSAMARTKDRRGRSSYDGDSLSLASFRESSELEYGADTAYALTPDPRDPESVTLRCLKHRHGEPVDTALCFDRRLQRFTPEGPAPTPTKAEPGKMSAALSELWRRTPAANDDDWRRVLNSDSPIIPPGQTLPAMDSPEPSTGRTKRAGGNTRPRPGRSTGRWQTLNYFCDVTMRTLSPLAAALWFQLFRNTKPDGVAQVSQVELARRIGRSVRALRAALRQLQSAGLVTVIHRGSMNAGSSIYRVRARRKDDR